MCDGGVATWNRSSGPRPRAAHPVAGGDRERAVGVAHRLRHPGGAGAEHEDRLVVGAVAPAVEPARGRTPSAARGGRVVEVESPLGAERAGEHLDARPRRRSPCAGSVSDRAWPTSAAFHAGLSSTAAAPSLLIACTTTMNSTRLVSITATRSPGPPRCSRGGGRRRCSSPSSSAQVQRSSPARIATRSPRRSAARLERAVHAGPLTSETCSPIRRAPSTHGVDSVAGLLGELDRDVLGVVLVAHAEPPLAAHVARPRRGAGWRGCRPSCSGCTSSS